MSYFPIKFNGWKTICLHQPLHSLCFCSSANPIDAFHMYDFVVLKFRISLLDVYGTYMLKHLWEVIFEYISFANSPLLASSLQILCVNVIYFLVRKLGCKAGISFKRKKNRKPPSTKQALFLFKCSRYFWRS